ncbi:LysE family transporter [Neobacillus sp. SM06]|uniref:LysE family transporter n=1 Tax=Neobacillus sp. SM06 TaxID=3422492 RepID=UPI003D2903A2
MELLFVLLHYLFLGFSLAAPIGPMNIEVLKRGLTEGMRSSWFVGLGGLTGDIVLFMAILFGIHPFLQIKIIQLFMYIFGVLMLSYLGLNSMYTALYKPLDSPDTKPPRTKSPFFTGMTISLANPISLVFWFGIYGTALQELTAIYSLTFSFLCSLAILLGLFFWNLFLVLAVHFSKKLVKENLLRGVTFSAGIFLLGFGWQFFTELLKLLQKTS